MVEDSSSKCSVGLVKEVYLSQINWTDQFQGYRVFGMADNVKKI